MKLSYANVASTLALAIALTTGGAYAAGQIGTKDLANNAVTSPKIKSGTIADSDLSLGVRKQVAYGQTDAPLRSGAKQTGTLYETDKTDAGGGFFVINVDLGGRASTPLTDLKANFGPDADPATTDDAAGCTGTFENPTAPKGRVCVYVGGSNGLTGLDAETWSSPVVARRAFYVTGDKTASSSYEFYATWAYTAP